MQIIRSRAGYPDRRCHADGVRRASYGIYADDAYSGVYKDVPIYHQTNPLAISHVFSRTYTASHRNGTSLKPRVAELLDRGEEGIEVHVEDPAGALRSVLSRRGAHAFSRH